MGQNRLTYHQTADRQDTQTDSQNNRLGCVCNSYPYITAVLLRQFKWNYSQKMIWTF